MSLRLRGTLAAALVLASGSAWAADDYLIIDALRNTRTIRAIDDGTGRLMPVHVLVDQTGAPYSTTNRLRVDGSGVTQPVSAATLPLPAGAATAARQDAASTILSNILAQVSAPQVHQADTTGTDFSANPAVVSGTLLRTIPANPNRALIEIQNQSPYQIQVVRDDGSGNQTTVFLLAGLGNSQAGQGWTNSTFKGRIRLYGPSDAQVASAED